MAALDDRQLRDEAVRDRIRAAEEFLDPSKQSIKATKQSSMLIAAP